ncbi:MAG: hypothetical protein KDB00_17325, partial [Planctomycetales bacterium]|nr:hypothetical protein [Planctomycetales bacterium]
MKPEDEATSRWSNVLWNVLGGNSERNLLAEVHRVELREDDSVLLCSDGLYRYLDAKHLPGLIGKQSDASLICRQLIDLANDRGGEDNITVIVAHPTPKRRTSTAGSSFSPDPAITETAPVPHNGHDS